MKRKPVNSSMIKSIGYDPKKKLLEVEFLSNRSIYRYFNVPKEIYPQLIQAESIGRYFSSAIKGIYTSLKKNYRQQKWMKGGEAHA